MIKEDDTEMIITFLETSLEGKFKDEDGYFDNYFKWEIAQHINYIKKVDEWITM